MIIYGSLLPFRAYKTFAAAKENTNSANHASNLVFLNFKNRCYTTKFIFEISEKSATSGFAPLFRRGFQHTNLAKKTTQR